MVDNTLQEARTWRPLQSETIDLLTVALVAARVEFPLIPRNRTAKIPTKSGGSYSYQYADLADILGAVVPVLSKHGLVVNHLVESERGVAVVTTQLNHVSGQFMAATLRMPVSGDGPQAMGSAITYGRRYGTTGILGIVTEDDDDAHAAEYGAKAPEAKTPDVEYANAAMLGSLRVVAESAGLDMEVYDSTILKAKDDKNRLTQERFDMIAEKVYARSAEQKG